MMGFPAIKKGEIERINMKSIILADTHFSDRTDQIKRSIFAKTMKELSESEIDYLVVAGDFLNATNCSPGLYKFLIESLQPLVDNQIQIILLIGDHAQGNPNQVSPLIYFSKLPGFQIIESPTGLKLGNKSCIFIPPSVKNLDCLNSKYDAVFYHGFLQNAEVSQNYRMYSKTDFNVEDFLKAEAQYYYFAGIHRRQDFDIPEKSEIRFLGYLGSFWQLTYGESGNPTGYLIWDTEQETTEFIEIESPKYKNVGFAGELFQVVEQLNNLELPEGKWNVKIVLDSQFKNEDLIILRKVAEKKNLLSLNFATKEKVKMAMPKTKQLSLEDSPILILSQWLKERGMEEKKREIVLDRAEKIRKDLRISK